MLIKKTISFTLLIIFLAGCLPQKDEGPTPAVHLQGRTMGTTYNIKIVVKDNFDVQSLQQVIDERLIDINNSMSTYIDDSELSQFNNHISLTPVVISEPLTYVMKEAIRLGKLTQGKLDVTVGPLVNLWGFGPEYRVEKKPSAKEINEAKLRVGIRNLSINNQQLSKKRANLYIDLSTIAKGYGVDIIADLIESNDINNYLVEIGGEMRLKGAKPDGTLWRIAVEKPVTNSRAVQQVIVPKDNAVATSGDYRNYVEVDGKRYSHIIDPDTAQPIVHNLVSVTVIHPSAMTADGLSTAMMVMGPEQGFAFAQANNLAAMFIVKTAHGFDEINTAQFVSYLK